MRPPVSVALWLPQERYEVNNGDTARIAVGSSLPDATVYYFTSDADTPVEYGVIELSNSITHIALPYDAQSADVVQVELVIVHGMQVHRKHVAVCRKQSDMRLTITPITFRDKTTPGSRETWRFVVRDANGNPLNALFMAELYDASLDALRPHSWHFNPRFTPQPLYPISVDYLWCMTSTDYASLNYRNDFVSACFVAGVEPMLRDYLLSYYGFMGGGRLYRSVAQVGAQELVAKNGVQADMISVEESSADVSYQLADEHSSPNLTSTPLQAIEYRDDMQETAFFYPHLV
ncbi:MAG: hypothetical protein J6U43_00390, partial [Bacteroidales bacterium]|nr:hypothetical protein [Bacteroidales bacterium]